MSRRGIRSHWLAVVALIALAPGDARAGGGRTRGGGPGGKAAGQKCRTPRTAFQFRADVDKPLSAAQKRRMVQTLREVNDMVRSSGKASGRQAMAVTVHEDGHIIFHLAVAAQSPLYARQAALATAKASDPEAPDYAEAARVNRLTRPYQELFADTLSVLYFDAPDAMARPLAKQAGHNGSTFARLFDVPHTNRSTRDLISNSYAGGEYEISAPMRSLVWKTYQKRLAGGESDPRPAILRALARAAGAEAGERLRTGRPMRSVDSFSRKLRKRLEADPDFTGPAGPE